MKKILFICMMLFALTASAQQKQKANYDTIPCNPGCITKLVEKTTNNGNVRVYAVYNDKTNGIQDIIPMPKTTVEYVQVCQEVGITPTLGIKLRNGQISSIVKLKKTWKIKR